MKGNDNLYKLGYNLFIAAFDNNNFEFGIIKAIDIIKKYFMCDEVSINQINENDKIVSKYSYPTNNYDFITNFLNRNKDKLMDKPYFDISITNQLINRITCFNIDNKYYLVMLNSKQKDNLDNNYIDIIIKSLKVILKNNEMYNNLLKAGIIDGLTGLENRLSFNKKVDEYNSNNKHITFAILDLFRLKYVNDNYGHIIGDLYIKSSSHILKEYFPKYILNNKTGDNIYRIGGDEFVVTSENKSLDELNIILEKVANEVKNLNLGIYYNAPIGINYGIAERTNYETMEDLYKLADHRLSKDKREMYEKLNINRRK